jgi:hypothetical protein
MPWIGVDQEIDLPYLRFIIVKSVLQAMFVKHAPQT